MLAIPPNARTTPAVRAEISRSSERSGVLAQRYGVSTETIRKWRKRRPQGKTVGLALLWLHSRKIWSLLSVEISLLWARGWHPAEPPGGFDLTGILDRAD